MVEEGGVYDNTYSCDLSPGVGNRKETDFVTAALPLTWPQQPTRASLLFLEKARHIPGFGHLLWLFPLPGMLFPQLSAWSTPPPPSLLRSLPLHEDSLVQQSNLSHYRTDPPYLPLLCLFGFFFFSQHLSLSKILFNLFTYQVSCLPISPQQNVNSRAESFICLVLKYLE